MSLLGYEPLQISPESIALADSSLQITWGQLDAAIGRGANALLGENLGAVPRCAIFAHNSTETVIAYLCALYAGVSSVPVNFHLTSGEFAHILVDSGAKLIFTGPESADVAVEAARMAGIDTVIGWRCGARGDIQSWDSWLATGSADSLPADVAPRPHLHYTSGTTGKPKGAETPANMLPAVASGAELTRAFTAMVAAVPPGPQLLVGPLYHTGPLGSIRYLAGGKPLVIMPRFDAEAVLAAIAQWRCAMTCMVPTHFQRLLSLPREIRDKYDVSSMGLVVHTGAACPIDVKRAMIEWWGPIFLEAYGGTESGTTNLISTEEWLRKPGSVGRAVPPFEMVVIGDNNERLGPGQIGKLYIRDPGGKGIRYHNDDEKTRDSHIEPGVFTLGEVGYVDDEGYVFITDRSSDMIVSGGVNIFPAEIEQVLIGHPAVEDVAVIGVPNREMGEEVKALVVAKPGSAIDDSELRTWCRGKLAGYKCPRTVEVVPDIGRNAMGKVNKKALRRPYWPSERTIGG